MMTKTMVAELLAIIQAFDRRTVGEADVEAWHLILADIDPHDASQAVKDHYRESSTWLMPADVHKRAIAIARARAGRERIAAIDAQIAAENGPEGQRTMAGITIGKPVDA